MQSAANLHQSRQYILRYEDFERSGHRIELEDIEDLLKYLGYEVEYKEISDEEMEELN